LTKVNLGTKENVQHVKVNSTFELVVTEKLIEILKEFKNVFAWTYKDLKGIPPKIAQDWIELNTLILPTH
jgi:flagellar biogenesis protein FliO